MTNTIELHHSTLTEPRDLAGFLDALGICPDDLELIAVETGWQARLPRKITAAALVAALCRTSVNGAPSYNDIASAIEDNSGDAPSKQGVGERLNEACLRMLSAVLQAAIAKRIVDSAGKAGGIARSGLFERYQRVLVGDSTVIRLPSWLFDEFSGVANSHGQVCNARIQAVYDLKSMSFVSFSIDSYSRNDGTAAPGLEIRPGDLVLRDRGYLSQGEIKRHTETGADFIYRHKTGTVYLDPESGDRLNLADLLRRYGRIDRKVLLGDVQVRLVGAPVDEETASLRRMKAKKENHGHAPSKAVLDLMGWTIFITSIGPEAPFATLLEIYGLRWRIEVIFKAWKSNMNFDVLHRVSALELRICLTARLVMITMETNHLYKLCHAKMLAAVGRDLSLLKFTRYLAGNPVRVIRVAEWLARGAAESDPVCTALRKYCCYDKRKRLNYHQKRRAITFESLT